MNMQAPVSDWTDERVELLKTLFPLGKSSSVIAREINEQTGTRFTRNSVIGKVSRLGLTRARPVAQREPRKPRTNKPPFKLGKSMSGASWRNGPSLPAEPLPPIVSFTDEFKCAFFETKNESCRWPLWEGDEPFDQKFVCGTPEADFDEGKPYCIAHSALGTSGVTVTMGLKRRGQAAGRS